MSNYRSFGAAMLAILVAAAITLNYRHVEAQPPRAPLPVRDVDVAARIPFQSGIAENSSITVPCNSGET
jgi:hypothetical protein